MYKLLIVDDEKTTRDGIRSIIDWEKLSISIIGEASDGLEAISMIYELLPDIVICDIKMPHIDGITLVSQIRDDFPNIQIIFLSGYSDKEYLRQAIRLNAVDYLDKPFRPVELLNVIGQACQRLSLLNTAEDSNLFNLISKIVLGDINLTRLPSGQYPMNFSEPYVTIIISYNNAGLFSNSEYFDSVEKNDIGLFLQQHLSDYQNFISDRFKNTFYAYILHNHYVIHLNTDLPFPQLAAEMETLMDCLPEQKINTSISFSRIYRGIHELRNSYLEAHKSMRNYLEGYGIVFTSHDNHTYTLYDTITFPLEDIITALNAQHYTDASFLMTSYFNQLKDCRKEDIPLINRDLISLALKIVKLLHPEEEVYLFSTIEKIKIHYTCINDIYSFLNELIEKLINQSKMMSPKNRIIYDIENYIINHYSEDLSLAQIAQYVYLTPTYMCHLYKKETGITIVKFITDIRMKRAYELLKNPNISLNTISELTGYKTPNYFTRAFSSYYHTSPSKMRHKLLVSGEEKNHD